MPEKPIKKGMYAATKQAGRLSSKRQPLTNDQRIAGIRTIRRRINILADDADTFLTPYRESGVDTRSLVYRNLLQTMTALCDAIYFTMVPDE